MQFFVLKNYRGKQKNVLSYTKSSQTIMFFWLWILCFSSHLKFAYFFLSQGSQLSWLLQSLY